VRDGFMAIFTTMLIETEGIGPTYTGTAWGFAMAISGIGSVVAPPLGNSLAVYRAGAPFAFWAALAVFGLGCLALVKGGARQVQRINRGARRDRRAFRSTTETTEIRSTNRGVIILTTESGSTEILRMCTTKATKVHEGFKRFPLCSFVSFAV